MSMSVMNESESNDGWDIRNSLTLTLSELFYPTFKRFFEGEDIVSDVEEDLERANISTPVEIYISGAVGYSVLAGLLVGAIVTVLSTLLFPQVLGEASIGTSIIGLLGGVTGQITAFFKWLLNSLQYPVLGLVVGGIAGAIVGVIGVGFSIALPKIRKRSRGREIDLILGDALAFMYSLSVGGTNQLQTMEAVAEAEDTYGEVSVEFKRIVYEMKYFNTDYQTAIENTAQKTPSEEFEGFLSDMLSVISSGGDMTSFLESQQQMMRERAKKRQEEMLDTLELFGQMYMSLNILPMGLIIVLVVISMMGSPQLTGMYITVYAILPGINAIFAVLIGTVKRDEVGDGTLDPSGDIAARGEDETSLSNLGVVDYYQETRTSRIFDMIQSREFRYRARRIFQEPWEFFRLKPPYVMIVTIPMTLFTLFLLVLTGLADISMSSMVNDPYTQTVMWVYIPAMINLVPLAAFYEWNVRTRGRITDTLTQDIRKLANANETGQPILEAMASSAKGRNSLLSDEFEKMYKKTKFGTSLSAALIEFTNRYRITRLARITKLIQKAQEASSNITEVLQTAATTSQYQDELEQDRLQRTRIQVMVTLLTYVIFLAILLMLDVYFLGELVSSVDISAGNTIGAGITTGQINVMSMLFFHAVTVQAICAGGISGYLQTNRLNSSFKYMVLYLLIAMVTWGIVSG